MIEVGISIVVILFAVGWLVYRRYSVPSLPAVPPISPVTQSPEASRTQPIGAAPSVKSGIVDASDAAADRLWKLAYAVPFAGGSVDIRAHERVRDNVVAVLTVDHLDPRYFPRRPALMPQLLQAVKDPGTATDKVSRMIAHDPVLTADVLRMANSSFYRPSNAPIETIPRAIVICGIDALRAMLATAMLQPVFRATRKNFPRLPRMLWDRTERASRAAELYALRRQPQDRFEAQLLVLLSAIGPLVVYGAIVDVYARNPHLAPNPALCIELTKTMGPEMALRIARDWQSSPRLVAALEKSPQESLTTALQLGELIGTVSFLETQTVITLEERVELLSATGMSEDLVSGIWGSMPNNV